MYPFVLLLINLLISRTQNNLSQDILGQLGEVFVLNYKPGFIYEISNRFTTNHYGKITGIDFVYIRYSVTNGYFSF
jgi:hypothetical protein